MLRKTLDKVLPYPRRHGLLVVIAQSILKSHRNFPQFARDDLVQEGHMRILKICKRCKRDRHGKNDKKLRNYLAYSAKGAMLDYLRTICQWRRLQLIGRENLKFYDLSKYIDEDPDERDGSKAPLEDSLIIREDKTTNLQANFMLSEVWEEDREIIKERVLLGLYWHQIGTRLGITASGACQRYRNAIVRARKKLKVPCL